MAIPHSDEQLYHSLVIYPNVYFDISLGLNRLTIERQCPDKLWRLRGGARGPGVREEQPSYLCELAFLASLPPSFGRPAMAV
jgi:hypothetical protein